MKLNDLIKELDYIKIEGNDELDIENLIIDSKLVSKGSLFICLKGNGCNGHDYVSEAERYGALAVVIEKDVQTNLTKIFVKNARKALAILSSSFYGNPCRKLKIIGVTGTNGKTTTSHFITSILQNAGIKCGLIGTIGIFFDNRYRDGLLTTPDPILLHETFLEMFNCGVEIVIMEVSAHACYYDKLYGIDFEAMVFTNFTLDHLDFFQNMENYKQAKLKILKENKCKIIVTNSDDEVGREILSLYPKALSYGINNPADVFAIDIKNSINSTYYVINLFDMIYNVNLNVIGEFNVYNSLASATVCALIGIKTDKIIAGIENLKGVSGRVENIYDGNYNIFIDYAHTPDGLKNAILTIKKNTKNRLICLFGCGGNRDKSKRKIMGRISGEYADFSIITSDNPRFEEPMTIIHQIEEGILEKTKNYILIEDRKEAINYALNMVKNGDAILIAGKGCEKYQEVYGIKHLYNDKDTVMEIMKGNCE